VTRNYGCTQIIFDMMFFYYPIRPDNLEHVFKMSCQTETNGIFTTNGNWSLVQLAIKTIQAVIFIVIDLFCLQNLQIQDRNGLRPLHTESLIKIMVRSVHYYYSVQTSGLWK